MAAHAGLDREIILQAAVKLVDEHGLGQLTIAMLAAQLNVRPPTLYHYFDGLGGVRRSLALQGLREMARRLGRAVMGKSGDDAIIALAYALSDFALEHSGLYGATAYAPEGEDPEWQAAGRETVDIGLCALSSYNLTPNDALHTLRIIRCIVHGWTDLRNADGFAMPLDVDETFRRMLDVLLLYLHTQLLHKEEKHEVL